MAPAPPAPHMPPAMRSYDLVAFDFDGTLADTFPWFVEAVNEAAERLGFRGVRPEEIETLRGLDNRALLKHFAVPAWKLPTVARHLRRMQAERRAEVRLFAGVPELFAALGEADVRIAVVTSNRRDTVEAVLGPALAARVAAFACGASLFGKAAKFREVVRRCGVRPDRALAVGDEIRDVEAAREAGLRAGVVAWGYARFDALEATAPDEAFRTVDALAARLAVR
jgi:phosphoglycolate phosphatase